MSKPLDILSLGAGVQSTTILRMSIAGEFPKLDAAIFADTGWERKTTYEHLEILKVEAEAAGTPLYVVQAGVGLRKAMTGEDDSRTWHSVVPMFSIGDDGRPTMGKKQCTREFKIAPIQIKIRALLGYEPGQRVKKSDAPLLRLWLGITIDEADRMKDSRYAYQKNVWPLIDWVPMTRQDCFAWHDQRGIDRPPRSACVGCPYQGGQEWAQLSIAEIGDAAEVEDAVRERDDGKRGAGGPGVIAPPRPLPRLDRSWRRSRDHHDPEQHREPAVRCDHWGDLHGWC